MISGFTYEQTLLEQGGFHFAWLIDMGDAMRITDNSVDIIHDGHTYVSGGDIIGLPSISRERGIKLQNYSFTLSGAIHANAALFSSQNWTGTWCEVFLVFLDETGRAVNGQPMSMYRGTLHTWKETDSGSNARVQVTLSSPWSKPNLTAGRITSDNSQKDRHPTDHFFKYAHRERKNLGWGADD